jgi:hypothetical protein
VKEIQEFIEGRGEKTAYLSLPRPGKHGTTSKGIILRLQFPVISKHLSFSGF